MNAKGKALGYLDTLTKRGVTWDRRIVGNSIDIAIEKVFDDFKKELLTETHYSKSILKELERRHLNT